MKKIVVLTLCLILVLAVVGCNQSKEPNTPSTPTTPSTPSTPSTSNDNEPIIHVPIKIGTLMGPTGMGMVKLMDDFDQGQSPIPYEFTVTGSPDDLVGKIISGELDVAAVPTNLALVLHNRTGGQVKLVAVNTLGVLYVLENGNSVHSISDLKGKDLGISGKGASPDFIIQYLLRANGLNVDRDLYLDYKLEHADLAAAMVEGDVRLGLLPQPHVTTAMMRNQDLRIALDITKEWTSAVGDDSQLAMGVIIAQKDFIENHKATLDAFLDEYKASVEFVNNQIDDASALIAHYGILPNENIAKRAIPYSNIVYVDAMDAKDYLEDFYRVLYDFNPNSIGGSMPNEDFFYKR